MPFSGSEIQRKIALHNFKWNDVPNINRHQIHRKEIQLPARISLTLRTHDIARKRSLPPKHSRLYLYAHEPPIVFHADIVTGRISVRPRNVKSPVRRSRHKTKLRPFPTLLASLAIITVTLHNCPFMIPMIFVDCFGQ